VGIDDVGSSPGTGALSLPPRWPLTLFSSPWPKTVLDGVGLFSGALAPSFGVQEVLARFVANIACIGRKSLGGGIGRMRAACQSFSVALLRS
jgi:hypothetical protein